MNPNMMEELARQYMQNCNAFMARQRKANFRFGALIAIGGYLYWRLRKRVYLQGEEIRALKLKAEESEAED